MISHSVKALCEGTTRNLNGKILFQRHLEVRRIHESLSLTIFLNKAMDGLLSFQWEGVQIKGVGRVPFAPFGGIWTGHHTRLGPRRVEGRKRGVMDPRVLRKHSTRFWRIHIVGEHNAMEHRQQKAVLLGGKLASRRIFERGIVLFQSFLGRSYLLLLLIKPFQPVGTRY